MPRRRLKHKQIVETIEQDDFQVAISKVKTYWKEYIHPYEGRIWTVFLIVVVAVVGTLWWSNHRAAQISDANIVLSEARSDFDSGDVTGALTELNKVLPNGEFSDSKLSLAAELVRANIAFASGEYDTAISTLTQVIPKAPKIIQTDLQYQLAIAQESKGDYQGALQTLEKVVPVLGAEPDTTQNDRKASVWDRYYFQKGRLLLKLKNEAEGVQNLLKISRQSPWLDDANREIAWWKAQSVEQLPTAWSSTSKS
jgi:predicted negative regulator of RcsB-dependent stress response